MAAATSSRSAASGSSGRNKENAPPAKSSKRVVHEVDEDEEDIEAEPVSKSRLTAKPSSSSAKPSKSSKPRSEDQPEKEAEVDMSSLSSNELVRRLRMVTSERDRLRTQRDTFSKQFDELSKLRNSEAESLFAKYKEKTALRSETQDSLIKNLTSLNETLQTKVANLEKQLASASTSKSSNLPAAGGVFEKADPKEIKALKEEIAGLQADNKKKDGKIGQLEKEYRTEVENSRKLQQTVNSRQPAPSAAAAAAAAADSSAPQEQEKDAQSLRLYEDLTDLAILDVKIRSERSGKEVTYNCVQTTDKRSVSFKLRKYNTPDAELVAAKADNPWVKTLEYTPKNLEYETDKDLLGRLGMFRGAFQVPAEQAAALWMNLRTRLSDEYEADADE